MTNDDEAKVNEIVEREVSTRTESLVVVIRRLMVVWPVVALGGGLVLFLFANFARASDVDKLKLGQEEVARLEVQNNLNVRGEIELVKIQLATFQSAMLSLKDEFLYQRQQTDALRNQVNEIAKVTGARIVRNPLNDRSSK